MGVLICFLWGHNYIGAVSSIVTFDNLSSRGGKSKLLCSKVLLIFPNYMCQLSFSRWIYPQCHNLSCSQPGEITSRRSSTDLARVWNKAVDETLGRLVVYLSSRGWWFKHHVEHGNWGSTDSFFKPLMCWCAHISLYPDWTCFVLKEKRYSQWPIYLELSWFYGTLPWTGMLLQVQCSSPVKGRIHLTILHIFANKECMLLCWLCMTIL